VPGASRLRAAAGCTAPNLSLSQCPAVRFRAQICSLESQSGTECLQVFGPGVSGGSAGAAVSFFVTCKDSSGKRIPEGGAHVEALVIPKSLAPANEEVAVLIRDNCDGSYTGVYTVSARGNYEVRSKRTTRVVAEV